MDRNYIIKITGITPTAVALRKESVDRNYKERPGQKARPKVALRKESVDRNNRRLATVHNTESRSPQGERG